MSNLNWKVWLVPFGVWGLYLCWYSGYQSGYAEGHSSAWDMARPNLVLASTIAQRSEFLESEADKTADGVHR